VVASRALDTVWARDADLASTRDRSTLSLGVVLEAVASFLG
jgi:hypothetical protein